MSNGGAGYSTPLAGLSKRGLSQKGPSRKSIPETCSSNLDHNSRHNSRELLETALRAAVDLKSFDVRGLDLSGLASFTDYFMVTSGTSPRHTQGIADRIQEDLRKIGVRPMSVTGYDTGEWIVLDYGDLVAHIFYEPTRQFYEFDEFWSAAPVVELEPELEKQVRHLRSGRFR